jgi:hypothetical protein
VLGLSLAEERAGSCQEVGGPAVPLEANRGEPSSPRALRGPTGGPLSLGGAIVRGEPAAPWRDSATFRQVGKARER